MYELNRVRLYNIGPTGARYGDVLLDLSDGGPPIPSSALIPSAGQLARRPALATLLVLENGGGKSVFIRMLLSTVLPDRQSRKGREALRAYMVSTAAPSHVVVEWVNVRTGNTLLTGQVLSPATDGKADRMFYSLNPNSRTTLATLPFAEGRGRLTMNDFHDALRRLDAADKSLHLEIEKRQGEWENHLRRLGLQPDLFAVQQAMNVDEGDAAEAFKTTTGRQFVEWLLSKALDAANFTELGKAFGAYAKNIGRREQLLLDRDFSTATAVAAQRLASQRAEQFIAATATQVAKTSLVRIAAEIRESVQRSEQVLSGCRDALKTATTNTGQRQQVRDKADLIHKELRRRTFVLRCDHARAEAQKIEKQLANERTELAAWTLVPKVLKTAAAHKKYQIASDLLDAAEQAAGVARLRRDQAGARFAGALQAAELRCAKQADQHADTSAKDKADAVDAERRAAQDERQATSNTVRAELLAEKVAAVDTRVNEAREHGILQHDEPVADADIRLRHEAEKRAATATRERETHTKLELEARRLDTTANQLIEPEVTARQAAASAARAAQDMDTSALALATETLVRELAELHGSEDVPGGDAALWLEANTPALRDLAATAQASAQDRLDALTAATKADQRLIEALTVEDNALMPPRAAVEDLVRLLEDRGIHATAGWRALEQLVNPRQHAEAIQTHPALVDGIVVADQTALESAQAALAEARPLPPAAVLIATAESLDTPQDSEPTPLLNGFVVEPTPALHDPDAATHLRQQAEARVEERSHALLELSERRTTAYQLSNRLEAWLQQHPTGHAAQLRTTAATASAAAVDAKTALDSARDAHTSAVGILDQHAIVVADTAEAAATAARVAESFGRLVADTVEANKNRVEITALEITAEEHRAAAQEHRDKAERLRNHATELAVQAESLRRDAASYTDRLKKVVFGNQPLRTDTAEANLAALEISYHEAVDGYRAVEVGEDLRRRVDDAQKEASHLDAELLSEPTHTVATAQALAATTEAGSAEAIEATKRRLGRAVETLDSEHRVLNERIGHLQAETTSASQRSGQPWTRLDADWTPSTPEDGVTLTERASAALNDAEALLTTASQSQQTAGRTLRNAETTARDMTVVHRSLTSAIRKLEPIPSGSTPFAGTADEAQHAADKATEAYTTASDQLHEASQAVDDAVIDFRETANQNRFGKLTAPVYKQLTDIDKTSLIERADQWATQLTGRAASLTSDLESSERHRKLLIDQLQHHVSEALTLLEKAERLSRLPDSAGVWAGRKILRIGFAKPEPQVLTVRIAETLDGNARTQPKLPGLDLMLRCVGAAVPRDFKVEILKPDSAGRAEYASISEMAKVFSGGQELTGAIMLYCTLAALRSSTRTGTRGSRLGGMLILDNPIGKASADYLLSLQMNMAAALGVQLIYTTGNMEDRVLATFPLCIRLRNAADQRTGTRHLLVTDRVLGETAPDEDAATKRISAARLLVKPHEPSTAPTPPKVAHHDNDDEMTSEQ